jgi:hypothetical protein
MVEDKMMKPVIVLGIGLVLLGGASGCGGRANDDLVIDMITVFKDTKRTLDKIANNTDDKALDKLAGELKKNGERLKEVTDRAKTAGSLDADEKGRLRDEYQQRFQKAIKDLDEAWAKVKKKNPDAVKVLLEKGALENFGN